LSFNIDRFEMKFVITREQRAAVMPRLTERMRADENAVEDAYYPIVSLYYDTPDRECYWEKVRGLSSRRKMRVRVYGSLDGKLAPTIFVEIKHKCDGRGVKRRLRVPLEEAYSISAGNKPSSPLGPVDMRIVDEIHDLVKRRNFQPCIAMRYDREAFADKDPESDLRVTFDTGIAYRFHDLRPIPDDRQFNDYLLPDGYSVMEVKVTGSVPYWLTHLVGEHHCILQGHSKYNNALEAGDSVLHEQLGGRPYKPHYGLTPDSLAVQTRQNAVAEPISAAAG
jgi:SPX domain protein involved in polyphosphate accumulation